MIWSRSAIGSVRIADPDTRAGRAFRCCGARTVGTRRTFGRVLTGVRTDLPAVVEAAERRLATIEEPGRVLVIAGVDRGRRGDRGERGLRDGGASRGGAAVVRSGGATDTGRDRLCDRSCPAVRAGRADRSRLVAAPAAALRSPGPGGGESGDGCGPNGRTRHRGSPRVDRARIGRRVPPPFRVPPRSTRLLRQSSLGARPPRAHRRGVASALLRGCLRHGSFARHRTTEPPPPRVPARLDRGGRRAARAGVRSRRQEAPEPRDALPRRVSDRASARRRVTPSHAAGRGLDPEPWPGGERGDRRRVDPDDRRRESAGVRRQ